MTISAAIKRLQHLEDIHGVDTLMVATDDTGDIVCEGAVIFDVILNSKTGKKECALMPQEYWETITPLGIDHKPV